MRYLDGLAQGSKYHRASKLGNSLQITAIEETDPGQTEFNKIAREAQKHAISNGHAFNPYPSARDPNIWDSAVIIFMF